MDPGAELLTGYESSWSVMFLDLCEKMSDNADVSNCDVMGSSEVLWRHASAVYDQLL